MAKLDRLGWAAGLAFTSHGARIGIRATDAALVEQLPAYLPPGWKSTLSPVVDSLYSLVGGGPATGGRVTHFNLLYSGASRLARTLDLSELLETLGSHLHFEVALAARRRLFVHAGVVAWRGRAIVIPGRSRTGKSTLVAALVAAGATYLSDEYAVFDARGRVHPYPKPLSLRAADDGPPRSIPFHELGGTVGTAPLPVGLVVVSEYRPGARWRPRSQSPARGMLALLANTVLARIRPAFALDTLHRGIADASILTGARGEAEETAIRLLMRAALRSSGTAGLTRRGGFHATEGPHRPTPRPAGRGRARGLRPVPSPRTPAEPDGRAGVAAM